MNDKMKNSIIVYYLGALVCTSFLMEIVKTEEVSLTYKTKQTE